MINTIDGRNPVPLSEAAHLLVPGRGRSFDGMSLSRIGLERASYAAEVWQEFNLLDKMGVSVVCSYKSPGDVGGKDYVSPEDGLVYEGIPEADLLANAMQERGVPSERLRRERRSIDTVTSLINAENGNFFPDNRPVAIVAQEEHLERIIKYIAPKTLRRDYIGVIVPEGVYDRDHDSFVANLVSRAILLGITPTTARGAELAERRTTMIWAFATKIFKVRNYNIDSSNETDI